MDYSEYSCVTNTRGIIVGDNACLLITEDCFVTYKEIQLAFLALPGVDPSLVSKAWIANAFQMIILKLVYLENSFDTFDKFEVLSPENVLLQLKYRYDREIDGAERPILRKIVEMDDVACKRMVLKVVDIGRVSSLKIFNNTK